MVRALDKADAILKRSIISGAIYSVPFTILYVYYGSVCGSHLVDNRVPQLLLSLIVNWSTKDLLRSQVFAHCGCIK